MKSQGFDQEQLKAIVSRLKTNMPIVCQVCGGEDWSVFDDLLDVQRSKIGADAPVGVAVTVLMVTCDQCQQALFFSLESLGLNGLFVRQR